MEFTHLSWQQSLGRTCQGHHNMVLSIPLYNGRSRKWPLCESRSHHCGSEPDGTGSHNSTNKKKNEVEIRFYTEKTAITHLHSLPDSSVRCILLGKCSGRCPGRPCRCLHFYRVESHTHFARIHRTSRKIQDGNGKRRC